jgi:hypothetical protein
MPMRSIMLSSSAWTRIPSGGLVWSRPISFMRRMRDLVAYQVRPS